jgi:hypothetical protein
MLEHTLIGGLLMAADQVVGAWGSIIRQDRS